MIKIKNISKEMKASIIYTFSTFFVKGLGIISLPFFTNYLSLKEIGLTSIYNTWSTILGTVSSLSLCSSAYNIGLFDFKNDRNKFTSSLLLLSNLSTMTFFSIYLLFISFFNNIMTLNTPLVIFMFLGFLIMPAMDFWMIRQRYEYKYIKCSIISIFSSVFSILISIYAVYYFKNSSQNLGEIKIYSQHLSMYLFAIVIYILIFVKSKFKIDISYWKYILPICFPLIFHALAKHLMDTSDRLMINYFFGEEATGIYGTLYNLASLILVFWSAINASIIPYMFNSLSNKEGNYLSLQKTILIILILFGVATIGITIIAPEIVMFLTNNDYYKEINLIPPIISGVFLTAVYSIYGNILSFCKKTKLIMISTIVAAISNIILNAIFLPLFGPIAASYTTLFSFVVLCFMQYYFSNKVFKSNVLNNKLIFLISFIVIVLCLILNIVYYNIYVRYLILFLILLICLVFCKTIYKVFVKLVKKE